MYFSQDDLFREASDTQQAQPGSYIHIRVQQRNNRKSWTTVQGLPDDLDLKKILKYIKKFYNTNGTIIEDEENGNVIQVQGDHRKNIQEFLITYKICQKLELKVHGF